MGKDDYLNKWYRFNWLPYWKSETWFISHIIIKTNSISIININEKNQMIKLLENIIGEYIHDLKVEKDSLDKTQKH